MTKEQWMSSLGVLSERDSELISRCFDTLKDNTYTDGGYLWSPYRCVSPGKGRFEGVWNWDTAFHAVGFSRWDIQIAKENIEGFFKFQREDGQIPDVIFEDGRIIYTASKPPLFAWATEQVYKREENADFIKLMYPKLAKHAEFMENNRCKNGLFCYDAENKDTDEYLMYVKFESGWDNSVRWDNGITDYAGIDLNCFMVMTYRSLAYIAAELSLYAESEKWHNKAKALSDLINEKMWDPQNKYYSDVNIVTGKVSDVLSPASFMPLYIEIASANRALYMGKIALEHFGETMPTVSFDNPQYSTDYWRGPVWLNVAYFAAKGLKNYGIEIADKIKENILDMCHAEKRGVFENYDAKTGEGLCCDHFSWSSVFIIEFILNW